MTTDPTEIQQLAELENNLAREVVSQRAAIGAIAGAVRRQALELNEPPLLSMLWYGPSGVGKTELARRLSRQLYGGEPTVVMVYGDDEAEAVTARLQRSQAAGLLLVENIQTNRRAQLALTRFLLERRGQGRGMIAVATATGNDSSVVQELDPQLLQELGDIVAFDPLSKADISDVMEAMLNRRLKNLEERGISVRMSEIVIKHLSRMGTEAGEGAHPLRRLLQQQVLNPLATQIVRGDIEPGHPVTAKLKSGEVVFSVD